MQAANVKLEFERESMKRRRSLVQRQRKRQRQWQWQWRGRQSRAARACSRRARVRASPCRPCRARPRSAPTSAATRSLKLNTNCKLQYCICIYTSYVYSRAVQTFSIKEPNIWFRLALRNQILLTIIKLNFNIISSYIHY